MLFVSPAGGAVVAADTLHTFDALDGALLHTARLTVSMLEASLGSAIPLGTRQRVLDSVAAGFGNVVAGRKDFVAVQRLLATIKGESNLAETDFGCPAGGPVAASLVGHGQDQAASA